ncbi:MAG: hypothetical protein AAGF93_17485 [Cyanobacteria bacterium P01_H01_bin.105]
MKFSVPLGSRPLLTILLTVNVIVVGLSIWAGISEGDLRTYFDEESFITWLSTFQLLAIAIVSAGLYILRSRQRWSWRSPAIVWLLIALGFAFLAADEFYEYHERLDIWLHGLLGIEETGLTDRTDDVIVGLYGVIAAGIAYRYRHEIKRYRNILPLLWSGFAVLFVMVFLDILTNRPDILSFMLGLDTALPVRNALEVLEEFCKLTVGSLGLVSVCRAFRTEKAETRRYRL